MKAAVIVAAGVASTVVLLQLAVMAEGHYPGKAATDSPFKKTYKLADCWCCDHARTRVTEESQEQADVYLSHSRRVVNSVKISAMRTWCGRASDKIVVPSDLEPFISRRSDFLGTPIVLKRDPLY